MPAEVEPSKAMPNPWEGTVSVDRAFQLKATQIATSVQRPTTQDLVDFVHIAQAMPLPDFQGHYEAEKSANTPRYREAVAAAEKLWLQTRDQIRAEQPTSFLTRLEGRITRLFGLEYDSNPFRSK